MWSWTISSWNKTGSSTFALFVCLSISAKPRADELQLQFTSIQKSLQRNSSMGLNVRNDSCFQGSRSIQSPQSCFHEYDCTIPKLFRCQPKRVKAIPLLAQSRQSDHLTYSYYLSTNNLVHTLLGDEYITGRWSKSACIDKVLTRLIGFSVAAAIAAAYCVLLSASRFFNWLFLDFWSTSCWVRGCCEKPNNSRGSSDWWCWWVGSSCIVKVPMKRTRGHT